jgi:hypothetical protein
MAYRKYLMGKFAKGVNNVSGISFIKKKIKGII